MKKRILETIVIGAVLAVPCWPQMSGGYTGPSVLSRGARPIGRSGGTPIRFRGYGSVSSVYATGLTPIATDRAGEAFDDKGWGATAGFGLYGSKSGRRSATTVSYGGGYQLFQENSYYNGVNHNVSVSHERQLNKRWTLGVGVNGTQMSNILAAQAATRSPFDSTGYTNLFDLSTDAFDGNVLSYGGQATASYQKSARWTFSMSGGTFITRRHSQSLASAQGYGANGEASYAISRRTQVGIAYSYNNFFYPKGFGRSDVNSWMGTFSRVLTKRWSFNGAAGLYRVESQRLDRVQVDPAVAALIGQSSSVEVSHTITHGLSAGAGLQGRYGRAGIGLGFQRGIAPGNGVYLTSQQDSVFANVSVLGTRRFNVGFFGNYVRLKQLFGALSGPGFFDTYGGGGGSSYRLFSFVHLTANADYRRTNIDNAFRRDFLRNRSQVSLGLAFSPGELPLNLF